MGRVVDKGRLVAATTARIFGWLADNTTGYFAPAALLASVRGGEVNVLDPQYASVNDAIDAATTAGLVAYIPAGTHTLTRALPSGTSHLRGAGKHKTTLSKAFDGDLCASFGTNATVEHLAIDGQGGTYTGKGLLLTGSDGKQCIRHARIVNFSDYCLDFTTIGCGSQFSAHDLEIWQTSGTTAGKYAIHMAHGFQVAAVPRKFTQIETAGKKFVDLGGCNDVMVGQSFIGEIAWTADSRGVLINGSRIGVNETAMDVDGHNNTIVGCDVAPAITIASGADRFAIGPNSYNAAVPVVDNSGNGRNLVTHHTIVYTPALTSGGVAPSLGDGTLTGEYARNGSVVTASFNLTVGATTTLGTGDLRVSLPVAPTAATVQTACGYATDASALTNYLVVAVVPSATAYATFRSDGGSSVTFNAPFTWATGDTLRCTLSYLV